MPYENILLSQYQNQQPQSQQRQSNNGVQSEYYNYLLQQYINTPNASKSLKENKATAYGPAEEADARRSYASDGVWPPLPVPSDETGDETSGGGTKDDITGGYASQLAAAQQAYAAQQAFLQQQYELQKQREAEARVKQEAAVQKARDALAGAAQSNYDSAVNLLQQGYDKNVGSVNTDTEKALQDAYISSMMQQRNLGQQLSAYGRSGGAAESTLLGLANAYGQQRGTLDNTRQKNLGTLEQGLQENKANQLQTLNTNKANYEQSYQNQLADLAGASLERLLNYDSNYTNQMSQLEAQKLQTTQSIQNALAQAQASLKQNEANELAQQSENTPQTEGVVEDASVTAAKVKKYIEDADGDVDTVRQKMLTEGYTERQIDKALSGLGL